MSQVVYELQDPFEYAYKGDLIKASFIEVEAPSFDQMKDFVIIKQALLAAVNEVQEESGAEIEKADEATEGADSPDGDTIMRLLYMWSGDLPSVMAAAKRVLTDGVASVEGAEKLTVPLLKKMSMRDYEGLVGTYLANFIMPSLMGGT